LASDVYFAFVRHLLTLQFVFISYPRSSVVKNGVCRVICK